MSGNAALASARRRRGEEPVMASNLQRGNQRHLATMQNPTSVNRDPNIQVNRTKGMSIHPLQLALEHDKKIFALERTIEQMYNTETGANNVSSETESIIQNNNSELKLLKTTIQKQQKAIQDMNSVITSLKANVINQNSTIEELTEQLNSITVPEIAESSENTDKKGTVKLDISDK